MKRYWPYLALLKPVKWQFLGGILAGLLYAAASGAGLPLVVKGVLPVIFPSGDSAESSWFYEKMQELLGGVDQATLVLATCLWIPAIFLLRALGGFLNSYLINFCGFRVLEQIRINLFSHLQDLPLSFFQKHQAGDLLARLDGDTILLRQVIAQVSSDLVKQPATLLFALGYLVTEGVKNEGMFVILIAIVSVPLCILPIRLVGKKLKKRARIVQQSAGDISAMVSENLQSVMEVRAYNLEEREKKKFATRTREFLRLSMKIVKYRVMISPAIEFVAALGFSVALYFAWKVGGMTKEGFMAIGMALYMAYEPVKKLGAMSGFMRQGEGAMNRIEEILDARNDLPEPAQARRPAELRGAVEFSGVDFAYGEEKVLSGIDLDIAAGECVALVGASGAGKSTAASLIPRFHDVSAGAVRVDGLDVREWAKADLRSQIAVVAQSPVLFSGTIAENILLGRPGASLAEVEEAARRAHAHDFIMKIPRGYEASVSEGGTSLSGGQRQRIALARAFLKDAPILILDEATSALDNESEARIQEALTDLVKGRTTIIIAHRLSTTKIAHRVIEFDRGRLSSVRAQTPS
ncbi:MAG: ABC transporter ATP-binding protein [Verrucomicrobiales bacterium]